MVKQIVDHAKRLAIRVVPEFDNPGHSRAIGLDPYFTEIVRCFTLTDVSPVFDLRYPYTWLIAGVPTSAPLDPSMDKTYEYIQGMLTDLNNLFPDSMIHLGGDEVPTNCYYENPKIEEYMQKWNISTYKDLIVSHMAKVRKMLTKINQGKRPIYWSNKSTFYQRY